MVRTIGTIGCGLVIATSIAACGGSTSSTTQPAAATTPPTQTVTQIVKTVTKAAPTQTVTKHAAPPTTTQAAPTATQAPPPPSGGGYASQYPTTFEASFAQNCLATSGGNYSACGCALKHIEQNVPYDTVLGSLHDIATGNPPSWYTDAAAQCR